MFAIAIIIELYSYAIFAVGLAKLLTPFSVLLVSALVGTIAVWYIHRKADLKSIASQTKKEIASLKDDKISILLLALILIQMCVNIVGTLGPELAFDALWYHLTLPKIFIEQQSISFIPGGLLYYSVMPKMIDILYIPSLMIGDEITAKFVHFSFGLFTTLCIYIFTRRYAKQRVAILAALIFYSNPVVAWQSTTAYIDLGRTLFEFLALIGFINFQKTGSKKWLLETGIIAGAALSTKWIAAGSIAIFAVLFFLLPKKIITRLKEFAVFALISLFVVLPHLVFSFVHTGNPFYPIFSQYYLIEADPSLISPAPFVRGILDALLFSSDPVSPIYLIALPLLIVTFRRSSYVQKTLAIYSILALLVWYVTPRTGGGRFILPYLPAFSVLVALNTGQLKKIYLKKMMITVTIGIALLTIVYRGVATTKYIPTVLGIESKGEFLSQNLDFSYGDFYDTDGFLGKTISSSDRVLVYGIHNLYYMNFPFVHESYIKEGDEFNYILVGEEGELPQRFMFWDKIYENKETGVSLYTNNKIRWAY